MEANENAGRPSRVRKEEAHEAASALELHLHHMVSDFGAIDDLVSNPRRGSNHGSPAHFDLRQRQKELEVYKSGIEFRSYVTVGKRPFRFAPGRPAPYWSLANPLTYLEVSADPELNAGTDIVYRTFTVPAPGGRSRGALWRAELRECLDRLRSGR
jgi:hypothetical protein